MEKSFIFILCLALFALSGLDAQAQAEVEEIFNVKCAICHTIGMGKLIGPDLAYIHEKRKDDWLVPYIRSSQTMINSGDPEAMAIYQEYNETVMPDPLISDDEIRSLIQFIKDNSGNQIGNKALLASVLDNISPEDIEAGQNLYQGHIRLENKGPSCISCHNMNSSTIAVGDGIAKEVSSSFENLGEAGVKSILSNPPFPVMTRAYKDYPLTPDEVRLLMAYLKEINTADEPVATNSAMSNFSIYGITGSALLIMLYSIIWFGRRGYSVNQDIYDRQLKSHN